MKKVKLITFLNQISNAYKKGHKSAMPYSVLRLPTSVEFKGIEFYRNSTLTEVDYCIKNEYGVYDTSIFAIIEAKDINKTICLFYD